MAELSNANWSEFDGSNVAAPPDGWPSGTMNPSQVEPAARAQMGGEKRFWNRINATVTTTGSAGAYVYTPVNTAFPTAYVQGETFIWRANFTSVGADTLNVNSLGAKPLYKPTNTGPAVIVAGDIQANQMVQTIYDGNLGASGAFQVIAGIGSLTTVNLQTGVSGVLQVPHGGTGASVAGGAALDNISGFGTNGYIERTGAGAYTIVADGTAHQVLHGGASWTAIDLVADITNTLTVAHGGTGIASGTSGGIPYFSGATTIASTGVLPSGGLLVGGGAGVAPFVPTDSGVVEWSISNGNLIGVFNLATAPPISAPAMLQMTANDTVQNGIQMDAYGNYSYLLFRRADGGQQSALSGIVANDVIGAILAQGYTSLPGYQANTSAAIEFIATGTWSNSSIPSQIKFVATQSGSVVGSTVALFSAPSAGGCQIAGNTSGVLVPSGNVGEYGSQIISQGSEISLTSTVAANVTSASIPAGDWDVWGECWFDTATGGAATATRFSAALSIVTASLPSNPADNTSRADMDFSDASTGTSQPVLAVPECRITGSTSTTVYLVARAAFTAGAVSAYGKIAWRRRQ